jgi:hypothetical protein
LKEFATEFGSVLTDIFNKSIKQCEVSKDWKQANVIPVFKKGKKLARSEFFFRTTRELKYSLYFS